jgi:head-tail adaptor
MQAGRLRHTITITEQIVSGQNSFGEDVVEMSDVGLGEFPCRVEFLEGRELGLAMQRWARARYKITMRHQPDIVITANMTATWEGRTLDIVSVQEPDALRPMVVLYAQDHGRDDVTH